MDAVETLPMMEVRDFAQATDCAEVIAAYERYRSPSATHNEFWDGRVIGIAGFAEIDPRVYAILQQWRHSATTFVAIQSGTILYSESIMVVRWDGQSMPPHRDHCHADGKPNGTPWREWSAILYLNDDFDGGRLLFPESGVSYRPVRGTLVLFPSSLWHGVEPVSDGRARYTLSLWFTSDPVHVDPLALMDY